MKGRLFPRLFVLVSGLLGLMAAAWIVYAQNGIHIGFLRRVETHAVILARSIAVDEAESVRKGDLGAVRTDVSRFLGLSGAAYIIVTDVRGAVLADTFPQGIPAEVAPMLSLGAGGAGRPGIHRLRLDDGREMLHVAQPLPDGSGGFVHLGMDLGPGMAAADHVVLRLAAFILAAFSACSLLAFFFLRRLTAPLRRVTTAAQALARGESVDAVDAVDAGGRDEFAILAESLRVLAGRIVERTQRLERERTEVAAKFRNSLDSFSAVVGAIADALLVVDAKGVILRHNASLLHMFRLHPEEIPGRSCAEVLGAEVAGAVIPREDGPTEDAARLVEISARRADGEAFPAELSIARICVAGRTAGVCILRDVSQAKRLEREREASRAELERMVEERTRELSRANVQLKIEVAERKVVGDALRRAEAKYRGIFEHAEEGIYQISPEGRYFSANPAMAAIFGYASSEELVTRLSSACPYVDAARRAAFFSTMEEQGRVRGFESRVRRADGSIIWISENARRVTDDVGETLYYEGFVSDITMRKEAESRLLHQAFHDPLTGLPNRLLFLDHLRMATDRAKRRPDFRFAVLYMDLDRFKIINDSLGHDIGDRLLRHVSASLLACARSTDTVARFGGDEFAILLEDISAPRDAIRFCRRILAEVSRSMDLAGREVQTTASLGIVLYTEGYDRPEALLRDADTAMYHAKAMGKGRFKVFNKRMHHQAQELMEMEIELRHAVSRDELCLMFQPIVDIEARRLSGFEALVRWPRGDGRLTPPSDFIPLAEETGIINPLDNWVFAQACATVRKFERALAGAPEEVRKAFSTNVNISARHFRNPLLVGQMEEIMRDCGVNPASLTVEITESVLLDNGNSAREVATKLREMGLGLCIDDFGTGYSSLSYIQRFSVDAIKIDKAFVGGLVGGMSGPGSEAIVRTIITLGAGLGLKVVAEGVETEAQLAFLRSLGCRFAQGYLFAPALAAADALRLVENGAAASWPDFPISVGG